MEVAGTPGADVAFLKLLEGDPTTAWPDAAGAALGSVL